MLAAQCLLSTPNTHALTQSQLICLTVSLIRHVAGFWAKKGGKAGEAGKVFGSGQEKLLLYSTCT